MLKHDPRWLMQRAQEVISKSQALCEQSRRAIHESKRLEERLGISHPKSDRRCTYGVDITRNL